MGESTTLVLNLTFFATLGVALLMFLGLFLLGVLTLILAGIGRLLALVLMALFGQLPKHETLPLVRLTGTAGPQPVRHSPDSPARENSAVPPRDWREAMRKSSTALKPSELKPRLESEVEHHPLLAAVRKEPPVLAEDWAAAVAEADARAMARARAAVPEVKVSVRDLPGPSVPAAKVQAVAPLVESALHQDNPGRDNGNGHNGNPGAARSFTKQPPPAPLSVLDTGSLESLSGHAKVLRAKLPADRS